MSLIIKLYQMHSETVPDERDVELATQYLKHWNAILKPRVGDYIIMPDGTYERFSYDWDTGLQTSPGGSFHLGDGYASFSGGLNPVIPNESILPTDLKMVGDFWMAHNGYLCASCGVGVTALCRVYVHSDYKGARIRPGSW